MFLLEESILGEDREFGMAGCYVVFHKQLGDLLLLEPSLARLRSYHDAPVRVLTRSRHRSLVTLMEGVEYQAGLPIAWKEKLYCYDPLRKSAVRSFFTPALRRHYIFPNPHEMEWFHSVLFRRIIGLNLEDQYVAEYFWENTPVPFQNTFRTPQLKSPPSVWKPKAMDNGSFILINPTSGWKSKNWLPERWAEVLKVLYDHYQMPLFMTNASSDWQMTHCQEIIEKSGGIVRGLEHTSLENFLWLCSRASFVLTVDGATSHLSQAFEVPSVTLFGPTSLANWHYPTKLNIAVQASSDDDGIRRMKNLQVGDVIEKIMSIDKL